MMYRLSLRISAPNGKLVKTGSDTITSVSAFTVRFAIGAKRICSRERRENRRACNTLRQAFPRLHHEWSRSSCGEEFARAPPHVPSHRERGIAVPLRGAAARVQRVVEPVLSCPLAVQRPSKVCSTTSTPLRAFSQGALRREPNRLPVIGTAVLLGDWPPQCDSCRRVAR